MIARRTALGLLGGLAGAAVFPAGVAAEAPRKPPRLREGDTVGLVAPASAVTAPRVPTAASAASRARATLSAISLWMRRWPVSYSLRHFSSAAIAWSYW